MDNYIDFSILDKVKRTVAVISKPALVFVEGQHRDKKGTIHNFSRGRVQGIVDNTNMKISRGERIPFQKDHKKDSDNNIGDLQGSLYTKVITMRDLPDPRHTGLVGKLGVFTDSLVAKGKEAVDRVKAKSIKTLSAGIDPDTESFIEISATPFPAIPGMALFSDQESDNTIYFSASDLVEQSPEESEKQEKMKNPMSMEDALGLEGAKNKINEEYNKYATALGKVLQSLYTASDEELRGKNPVQDSYKAIEFFNKKIEELFELVDLGKDPGSTEPNLPTKTVDKDLPKRRNSFSAYRSGQTITFGGRLK